MFTKVELEKATKDAYEHKVSRVKIQLEIPGSNPPSQNEYNDFFKEVKPNNQLLHEQLKTTLPDDEFTRAILPNLYSETQSSNPNPVLVKFGKVNQDKTILRDEIAIDEYSDPHPYFIALLKVCEQNDYRPLLGLLQSKIAISEHFLPLLADLVDPNLKRKRGQPPKITSFEAEELYLEITRLMLIEKCSYTNAANRTAVDYGLTREKIQEYYRSVEQKMTKQYPWTSRDYIQKK